MASTPVLQSILNAQQPSNVGYYSGSGASGGNGAEVRGYLENGLWVPKSQLQGVFQDMPSYSSQLQNILSGNIPTNTSPTASGALSASEQGTLNDLSNLSGFGTFHDKSGIAPYEQGVQSNLAALGLGGNNSIDWSQYPELQQIMQQDQSQGTTALGNYMTAQQANESQFINPMEAPKNDQFSITNSLSGNSPTNQIMSQYENQYNTTGNQLATEKQTFINNLNQTQSQVTSELQQLTSPDTLKSFVYGTTGNSILGSLYGQVQHGRMPLSDYQQMATSFTDVAANNLNFINSYNNLFQNFLGLNINLNDQINGLKSMVGSLQVEQTPQVPSTVVPSGDQYNNSYARFNGDPSEPGWSRFNGPVGSGIIGG